MAGEPPAVARETNPMAPAHAALKHGATVLMTAGCNVLLGRFVKGPETVPGVGPAYEVVTEDGITAWCATICVFDMSKINPKRCHVSAVMGRC